MVYYLQIWCHQGIFPEVLMEKVLNEKSKKNVCILLLKILLFCALAAGGGFLWLCGCIAISFRSVNPVSMGIFWTLLLVSLLVLFFALIFHSQSPL